MAQCNSSLRESDRERLIVSGFLKDTHEDVSCPSTPACQSRIESLRRELAKMDEGLENDRKHLKKVVSCMQKMVHCGEEHVKSKYAFSECMEKLGTNYMPSQPKLGTAFLKIAVILKDLTQSLENQVKNMNNIVLFPLDALVRNDMNSNLRKPTERCFAEYERARTRVEREAKRQNETSSSPRPEPEDRALGLEKERRAFQLATCDYLLKVNEISQKKTADFAQHLVDFYHSQCSNIKDSQAMLLTVSQWVTDMANDVTDLRKLRYEDERNELAEMKKVLTALVAPQDQKDAEEKATNPGMKQFGDKRDRERQLGMAKCGILQKRTEGIRKVWQKRYCTISDGMFTIAHSARVPPTVTLPLLTCQCKDETDQSKKPCFALHSQNRKYVFQAEDTQEKEEWVGVLNNTLEHLFNSQLTRNVDDESQDVRSMNELIAFIVKSIRSLPGNHQCCDCNASDPPWISTNLGVLVCIECSGVHRELGVQFSRVRSLVLDNLCTAELLVAHRMGNYSFNEVSEENLSIDKLSKDATMVERKEYIRSKYVERKWVRQSNRPASEMLSDLKTAICCCDLVAVLNLQQEGVNFTAPLPAVPLGGNALHLSLDMKENVSHHVLDFIINNGGDVNLPNVAGSTPLHIAVANDLPQAIKLLLRAEPRTDVPDQSGRTPHDLAVESGHLECAELFQIYGKRRKAQAFNTIKIEWGVEGDQNEKIYEDLPNVSVSPHVLTAVYYRKGT